MLFGYYWVAALLVGSLLASHTLLGFPITQQLGLPAVTPFPSPAGRQSSPMSRHC